MVLGPRLDRHCSQVTGNSNVAVVVVVPTQLHWWALNNNSNICCGLPRVNNGVVGYTFVKAYCGLRALEFSSIAS